MKLEPKLALPIVVVTVGALGALAMVAARPSVATRQAERMTPLVRTQTAEPQSVQLRIQAQGSVVPRTESELVAEVSGRITWVSPSLAPGGFLDPGEALVRIDPGDYEVAVERADAALARAESELAWADSQRSRTSTLADRGVASSADLDAARNASQIADAAVREARAALTQARRNLERTVVVAPFAGRVREKRVDVGQFVSRGAGVARIYAVDYAEVRLPIPDAEAAYVDLPFRYRDSAEEDAARGPSVALRAHFAGREYTWHGRIVRTEGEIDPRTRMIHAVARVEDPYGRGDEQGRPPLAVGLFVQAEIEGRLVENVVALPRSALRSDNQVVIIDDANRLRLRTVDVLRRGREHVLVRAGIERGERVCVSPLSVTVEGMEVTVVENSEGDDPVVVQRRP